MCNFYLLDGQICMKTQISNFDTLLPDFILDAIQEQGFMPTGMLLPLNSYENRVYQIGLEDHDPIIAKFYRPGRWTDKAIGEEHSFVLRLLEEEIPVVAPLGLNKPLSTIPTLAQKNEYYYALFPKARAREQAEINNDDRRWLGRHLARIHNIGSRTQTKHRMKLNPVTYGENHLTLLMGLEFIPADLKDSLKIVLETVIQLTKPYFHEKLETILLHGDCHLGNVLWNTQGPLFLDFDDMVIAPAVQDVWMLLNGTKEEKAEQLACFMEGYETFREFDYAQLKMIEALRSLRMIHYAAWIALRHEEGAFKRAFPYFKERKYWEDFLNSMKEQLSLLQEVSYLG